MAKERLYNGGMYPVRFSSVTGHNQYQYDSPSEPFPLDRGGTVIECMTGRGVAEVPGRKNGAPEYALKLRERARRRPRAWAEYMTQTPQGERFNFQGEKHQAALGYVDRAYEAFKVRSDEKLLPLMEEYGVDSLEAVREKMWRTRIPPIIDGKFLLPNDYHVPNLGHYDGDFFGWDNLWSVKWAIKKNDLEFAKGVIDNGKLEYNHLGYWPNSNDIKIITRPQGPVGALMFTELDKVLPDTPENNQWRRDTIAFLKNEYLHVWVNDPEGEKFDTYQGRARISKEKYSRVWPNVGLTPTGLSRYAGADIAHNQYDGEAASGEDCGPRFEGRPSDYNPTDLAALRGIAQKLFADFARREGNEEEARHWESQFEVTKKKVNDLMWNKQKGWYMDYNFVEKRHSRTMSLAAFLLVRAGMVPKDRLDRMVENLDQFMLPYGLAVTTGEEPPTPGRSALEESWKFPNRWAPREDLVFDSLMEYPEYHDKLEEMLIRSQIGSAEYQDLYKNMPEVLNGQTGKLGGNALYPRRTDHKGFLWTNEVYLDNDRRLQEIYDRRDQLALIA